MRGIRITDRDRVLLSFVAEHRFVLSTHVEALLGVSSHLANRRLRALTSARLLSGERGPYGGDYHLITRRGLDVIGSDLPRPRFDVRTHWHDVGIAWLWLAARAGAFGSLSEIVSERRMRSNDGAADQLAQSFGVRLGGWGVGGRARLHYPDLLLEDEQGHRVAIELELSGKKRTHREKILAGYSFDRRIDAVVYFVDDPAVARAVNASVARLGLSSMVHVQRFEWDPRIRPAGRAAAATSGTCVRYGPDRTSSW